MGGHSRLKELQRSIVDGSVDWEASPDVVEERSWGATSIKADGSFLRPEEGVSPFRRRFSGVRSREMNFCNTASSSSGGGVKLIPNSW